MSACSLIVPATREHAVELAPRLRATDVAELLAARGMAPLAALLEAIERSDTAEALLLDGEVVALFGTGPYRRSTLLGGPAVGVPWLLGSDALTRDRRLLVRLARRQVVRMLLRYPILVNAVDARYAGALSFARWLGFEVGPPAPFGAAGLPFCLIRLRRPDV